jgi:hypothetical protein
MNMQIGFNITVVIFTVSNLAALGLELNLREALITTGLLKGDRL